MKLFRQRANSAADSSFEGSTIFVAGNDFSSNGSSGSTIAHEGTTNDNNCCLSPSNGILEDNADAKNFSHSNERVLDDPNDAEISATVRLTAVITELKHELRDKLIECEALYETAAALSQALQESDRLLESERLKNEKLLLKISMICCFEEIEESPGGDVDGITHECNSNDAEIDGNSVITLKGKRLQYSQNGEDTLTTELRNRAKKLSLEVMSSSNAKLNDRLTALKISKQLQMSSSEESSQPEDSQVVLRQLKRRSSKQKGDKLRSFNQDGTFDSDDETASTMSSSSSSSASVSSHEKHEKSKLADEGSVVTEELTSNSDNASQGVIASMMVIPMDDVRPPSFFSDKVIPTRITKVEKPTSNSLPSQANFYQIILERDIAQTNVKRLSKELKQRTKEIRQLKSRLDLSTALVEISYAGTEDTDDLYEDSIEKKNGQHRQLDGPNQDIESYYDVRYKQNIRNDKPIYRKMKGGVTKRCGWIRSRSRNYYNHRQQQQNELMESIRTDTQSIFQETNSNNSQYNYYQKFQMHQKSLNTMVDEVLSESANEVDGIFSTNDFLKKQVPVKKEKLASQSIDDPNELEYMNAIAAGSGGTSSNDADKAGGGIIHLNKKGAEMLGTRQVTHSNATLSSTNTNTNNSAAHLLMM